MLEGPNEQPKKVIKNEEAVPEQVKENTEARTETVLSPEVVERVMAKVQDINLMGTAYSSIDTGLSLPLQDRKEEKLGGVLQSGVLGLTLGFNRQEVTDTKIIKPAKQIYADFLKKRKRPNVFFNIVGRAEPEAAEEPRMNMNSFMFGGTGTYIVFDLSPFKEVVSELGDELSPRKYSNWYHSLRGGRWPSSVGDKSAPEFGFRLSSRVPPRLFRGVVIGAEGAMEKESEIVNRDLYESRLLNKSKEVIDIMLEKYKEKPEYLLPIYDEYGNLLWPKQMKYEEVKQFVADRDKSKSEG